MSKTEGFALIVAILFIAFLSAVAGYGTGFYNGQRMAKEGKFRYQYETNIVTSASGATTNVDWVGIRK